MCGCTSNFVEDEGLNFSGNRPSLIEVGETWEDPSFDFTNELDGNTEFDNFFGKKAKARRQERREKRKGGAGTTEAGGETRAGEVEDDKNAYGTSSWFSNNWIYLVIGVAVVGGGYYFYKKRK